MYRSVRRDAIFLHTFVENSAPTKRLRLQIEQSKSPAHLSVTTGVDILRRRVLKALQYQQVFLC